MCARGRAKVEHQGQRGHEQNRSRRHAPPALRAALANALTQQAVESRQAHADEESPHLERQGEEVVPLADLVHVHLRVDIPGQREAGLEVHVAHQPRARGQEQEHQEPERRAVDPPQHGSAVNTQADEREREREPRTSEHGGRGSEPLRPLPVEVLQVHLGLAQHQRNAPHRIAARNPECRFVGGHRPVHEARQAADERGNAVHQATLPTNRVDRVVDRRARRVLLARDHRPEALPRRRIGLVEERPHVGANDEEQIGGHADDRDRQHRESKDQSAGGSRVRRSSHERDAAQNQQALAAQTHTEQQSPHADYHRPLRPLGLAVVLVRQGVGLEHVPHEPDQRGSDQQCEQMAPDGNRQQVDDQQQHVRRALLASVRPPHPGEPADRRDGERGDHVYLGLVGVLPHGEHERREPDRRSSTAHPIHRVRCSPREGSAAIPELPAAQRLRNQEEHQRRRGSAEHGSHQVGAVGELADRHQRPPHVAHQDEQRRPRGMWYAEDLGRGDELARVPERDGRR